MRTTIPEKLLSLALDIEERGSADPEKLHTLEKWFEQPHRLAAFAVFVANRASGRIGKTMGQAALLFGEARALLAQADRVRPELSRSEAVSFFERLQAFQNEPSDKPPGRMIKNRNLFLVEEGLRIYLWHTESPIEGVQLAEAYCLPQSSHAAGKLDSTSLTKVEEVIRFMFTMEALEDLTPNS